MLIEEKALKHWIDHFYGYGSWHAAIWFVAYEDGGGDVPEEVAEKLNHFSNTHGQSTRATLCDIREMYKHFSVRWEGPKADLFSNLYEYRFGNNAVLSGVWKNLIAFTHGYQNKELPDLLEYQKKSLALSSARNEALVKLYPLPSPHNHAWYYSWLDLPQSGFLKTRALYQEHVYDARMKSILHNIKEYKPEVVLMYGMDNINRLKKSVQDFFPGVKFKMIQAIKRQIPQHHITDINGTALVLTTQIPTLRHNRIETGFDWQEFGKNLRQSA